MGGGHRTRLSSGHRLKLVVVVTALAIRVLLLLAFLLEKAAKYKHQLKNNSYVFFLGGGGFERTPYKYTRVLRNLSRWNH